jgi:hypothetical protein
MESTTLLLSTKKPGWRHGLGAVRRLSSQIFKKPNIRSSSPTPSEYGSDSPSIKGFPKASSLELMDTKPTAVAVNGHLASSPNAENSKSEAVVLMSREILTATPENTLELPIIANEIASDCAPLATVAQLALTSEPEETTAAPEPIPQPADEQELVPTNTTKPPHGTVEPAGLPLVYLKDTQPEPDAAISVENISAPHPEALILETVPPAGEPTGTSFVEAISFDMTSADPQPHDAAPDDAIWASFEIPSYRKSDSDSSFIGDSCKAPSVRLLDAVPLSSAPAENGNHVAPSLIVESSTRGPAALASEPVGYAASMDWEILLASPKNTLELPVVVNEIGSIRAASASAEQLVLNSELEETMTMPEAALPPAIEQDLIPIRAANPPLIYVDGMHTELARSKAAIAVEAISAPNSEATSRETASSIVEAPIRHPSVENGPISNFDMPASQAIPARSVGSNENSSQIRPGKSAAPVKRSNSNKGQGQRKLIVP